MNQHLLQQTLLIGVLREVGDPGSPHDDALRNQVDGGVQQPQIAEHRLGKRVPHEAGVGADGGVLIDGFFSLIHAAVGKDADQGAQHLNQNRHDQHDRHGTPELCIQFFADERLRDVAGQNDIQDQVRQAFFALFRDDSDSAHQPAGQHEQKHFPHQGEHLSYHARNSSILRSPSRICASSVAKLMRTKFPQCSPRQIAGTTATYFSCSRRSAKVSPS